MTEGVWIAVITQVATLIALLIEGRKTRKANKEDNTKTKYEVKQLIKDNETNS